MANRKLLICPLILALFVVFSNPLHLQAAPSLQAKLPTATATSTANKRATATQTPMPTATATITSTRRSTPTTTAVESTPAITATVASAAAPVNADSTISPTLDSSNGPPFDWATSDNYLILGTDRREGWTDWRTDTIILVGLDRANARAAVFSIPRDLYVQIPGYGMGRINQVDFMGERRNGEGGGPLLISQVLSETLGVAAQHWIRVQMTGFISFVDAVGGVTVTLDCPFSEPIFNLTTQSWEEFSLPAGDNLLDGQSAYWFVRLRLRESDIGRGNRQRQFLWALRNKVLSTNLILRAPELWQAFNDTFSTDLDFLHILDVGTFGLGLKPENVRASGLTLADLQNFITSDGQQVLRIGSPAYVRSKLANVWAAPAMVDSNRHNATTCQPLPDPSALNLPAASGDGGTGAAQPGSSEPANSTATSTPSASPATAQAVTPNMVIGNRVRLRRGYTLSVRSKPGESAGRELGSISGGEECVILGGPSPIDGIVWWYVRTDSGAEGWIPGNTSDTAILQVVQ